MRKKVAMAAGIIGVVSLASWTMGRPIASSLVVASAIATASIFLVAGLRSLLTRLKNRPDLPDYARLDSRPLALRSAVAGGVLLCALALGWTQHMVTSSDAYRLTAH